MNINGTFIFVQHVGYYLWHSVAAAAAYTSKRIMIATTLVHWRAFFQGGPLSVFEWIRLRRRDMVLTREENEFLTQNVVVAC